MDALEKKAAKVVDSCNNRGQLDSATQYIELFFKRTKNLAFFKYLITKINDKLSKLS